MGDFFTPKKKDLCDKLRRRFNTYRQHHSSAENRYLNSRTAVYEQQKQETQQLRQRWLDSRAKKTAKQSKTNRDNNNSQNDHRSNLVVTKLKKKIDGVGPDVTSSTTSVSNTTAETVFSFNDQNGTGGPNVNQNNNNNNNNSNTNNNNNNSTNNNNGAFQGNPGAGIPSVSVQIVQQISALSQQETSQTIHTNVTVSSRYGNSNSPDVGGGGGGGASHSVHTSVQCKQEPPEDVSNTSRGNNNSNNSNNNNLNAAPTSGLGTATSSSSSSISSSIANNNNNNTSVSDSSDLSSVGLGINNVDDIQNFFDSLEKRGADIEPALLRELNEFDEIVKKKCHQDSSSNDSPVSNMYGPLACGSPPDGAAFPHNMAPHHAGPMGSMFDGTANASNPGTLTNHSHNHSHTIPVPTAIPEPTGPAAETLKQMAAQHQHQHQNPTAGYPMKHVDQFSDGLRNGFNSTYPQPFRSTVPNSSSPFPPFNPQQGNHLGGDASSQMNSDLASPLAYGATKPLTHFSTDHVVQNQTPPSSSLQQLQNQVQSHFKPTSPHHMQITQTQQMQVSHGSHSLQMTQTQQVQMQPPPQSISLSQQQNFNMGQQQQHMMPDQMKMQMMEKMRMEQQQQQQQQAAAAQQGRMPPQYMGRPPPEYKMHPNARPQNTTYSNTTGVNSNPLQTMQNMVNQTSAYGVVKSEVPTGVTSGGPNVMQQQHTTQISAVQQQSVSMSSGGGTPSHMANLPPSSRPAYHHHQQSQQQPNTQQHLQQQQQHLQQQQQPPPAYSSSLETVSASSRVQQQSSTNNFTSALMRNQRPPNVNVGPDGLNITQPRTHSDWSSSNAMMGSVNMMGGMRPQMGGAGLGGGPPPPQHTMTQQSSSMSTAHMMQYQHRPPHYGHTNAATMAQRQQHQQQQQHHHHHHQQQIRPSMPSHQQQQVRSGSAGGMIPNSGQMMMQHQAMQVSQMTMRSSSTGYAMAGASPGPQGGANGNAMQIPQQQAGGLNSQQSQQQSQTSNTNIGGGGGSSFSPSNNADELLNFLDNPPMFDSIQTSTADDLSLFDDLLNGK